MMMVEVTQADRNAAFAAHEKLLAFFVGGEDESSMAESFAKHRIQSTADLQAKLDKAVEALQEIDNIAGAWPLSEGYEDSLDLLEMCGKVSVKTLALITAKSERDE